MWEMPNTQSRKALRIIMGPPFCVYDISHCGQAGRAEKFREALKNVRRIYLSRGLFQITKALGQGTARPFIKMFSIGNEKDVLSSALGRMWSKPDPELYVSLQLFILSIGRSLTYKGPWWAIKISYMRVSQVCTRTRKCKACKEEAVQLCFVAMFLRTTRCQHPITLRKRLWLPFLFFSATDFLSAIFSIHRESEWEIV